MSLQKNYDALLTRYGRERCCSFICSTERTRRPRSASWKSSCWISSRPLVPLAVSELLLCVISASKPISVVQLLKLCDLGAEVPNLYSKRCEMIHAIKNSSSATIEHGAPRPRPNRISRHELRVPLGMSRIHPAIPVDPPAQKR